MRRLLAAVAGLLVAVVGAPAAAQATPGPPDAPQYWFDDWNIFDLWAAGVRGQGVTIAEIDTGVNADLPELTGRVVPGTDLGQAGDGQVDREVNEFGHGTAMASIMVARSGLLDITGLAPDAKIMPIAVPLNGTAEASRPDRLPDAIRYSADHGAKIISMSLGGKRFPTSDSAPCPDEEQAAVFHALRKGAIVIASVGNTGPTKNTVEEPGVCLGVVSVGAVNAAGKVAGFSARQPYLSLVAPGTQIPSLGRVPGQAYSGDGTSQATAIVSAAAALVWSKYPKLTAEQVVSRILATLEGRRTTHSRAYGYGLLDAYRAVTATVPASATNPVYAAVEPFLKRDAAFGRSAAPKPPRPAAKSVGSTGEYAVGDAPRVTPRVQLGLAMAAAGLLALLVLLVTGRRRQRVRTAAALPPVGGPNGRALHPRPRPAPSPHAAAKGTTGGWARPYALPAGPPLAWPPPAKPRPRPSPRPRPQPGALTWRDVPADDPPR